MTMFEKSIFRTLLFIFAGYGIAAMVLDLIKIAKWIIKAWSI